MKHGKNKTFNTFMVWLAAAMVVAGVVAGIWFFIFYRTHETTNDAQVEQYITPIAGRVNGYIREIRYEENQYVHKGDTLVIIDDRENRTKLAMAQAELENARSSVCVLQKGATTTGSTLSVHRARLEAARAQLWKTKEDYKRYTNLLREEAVTQQQYEQARAAYDAAKAGFEEIEKSIQTADLSTSEATSRITVAETMVRRKEAEVENAALFLSYTVLTAPYDGWMGRKTIQEGQLVKEGQTLVSMVSREKWVIANFKETQLRHLYIGQPVEIRVDALGDQLLHGRIASLSPASGARFSLLPPDNSTGNFVKIEQRVPVKIWITDPETRTTFLRAGMNVVVTVKDGGKE